MGPTVVPAAITSLELFCVLTMCYFSEKVINQAQTIIGGSLYLSCFGKLFTSILNNRLNNYLENMNIIAEKQAGFRKGYSTTDHIFNLKCLIDLYLFGGKKLYCSFIDYKKAFDSVNRVYLWQKLINNNIDGKMFKLFIICMQIL